MGAIAILIFASIVVSESTELLDRCVQGKNMTWPKDECNSVILEGFYCRKDGTCPYEVLINRELEDVEMYLVKLDSSNCSCSCNCNCNCNCNPSEPGEYKFTVNTVPNQTWHHTEKISNKMEHGCYRYYSSTQNITSCCILFPASDSEERGAGKKVEPDYKAPVSKENDKDWYYWGISGMIGAAALVLGGALCYVWKKDSPTLHPDIELSSSPSRGIQPPLKAGKNNCFLLIYANQFNPELINELIKAIKSGLKDCTVTDYKKCGNLLEKCWQNFDEFVEDNKFDKVMVLLSPEVSTLQPCDDVHGRFLFNFFKIYLPHTPPNDKIIYLRFEQFPCPDFNFGSLSIVYALPTKLRDLLLHLDL